MPNSNAVSSLQYELVLFKTTTNDFVTGLINKSYVTIVDRKLVDVKVPAMVKIKNPVHLYYTQEGVPTMSPYGAMFGLSSDKTTIFNTSQIVSWFSPEEGLEEKFFEVLR